MPSPTPFSVSCTFLYPKLSGPSETKRNTFPLPQSETCRVEIPELEFELGMGALGGKFTTLEGLLKDIQSLVSGLGLLHISARLGRKCWSLEGRESGALGKATGGGS